MIFETLSVIALGAITGAVGHLYLRTSDVDSRLIRQEAVTPEVLRRIEGKIDEHLAKESETWQVIRSIDQKVNGLITDVTVLKGGRK